MTLTSAPAQMPPPIHSLAEAEALTANLSDKHGFVLFSDKNTWLFYRYWPAQQAVASDRAVVVLHGIGYHSGPYKVIANEFNPKGIDVYALDARGHGFSCGKRGYLGTPAQVAQDVASMLNFVKQQRPGVKLYLLGESMGGAYALNYMRTNPDEIAGLVLLAPALDIHSHQVFKFKNLALLPYLFFSHRAAGISLIDERLEEGSRDPSFIAERRSDSWAYKKVSFGYLWDIHHLVRNWTSEIAPRANLPTLIVQGGKDVIVSAKSCRRFVQQEAAKDKQYKVFPESRHTTLWDPETPAILQFVAEWISQH